MTGTGSSGNIVDQLGQFDGGNPQAHRARARFLTGMPLAVAKVGSGDAPCAPAPMGRRVLSVAALLAMTACGARETTDILPGGIPARTDLHQASALPPDAVRTVARRDFGWRLIYHPARAMADAEQRAAFALCGLERRAVRQIVQLPRIDPTADPGARMIDIYCA